MEPWKQTGLDDKWSPAEVNQILFRNFENPQAALDEFVNLSPADLYGFENEVSEVEIPAIT